MKKSLEVTFNFINTKLSISFYASNLYVDLDLINLESLNLQLNYLETIHVNQFKGLEKLRKLNLCRNNLKKLDEMTLQNLHCLEILDLSKNQLIAMEDGILKGLGLEFFLSKYL